MLTYPKIDPILVSLGPFKVRWYAFMYILGICGGFALTWNTLRQKLQFSKDQIYNLINALIIGVILGGRLGYILFYNLTYYINNPLYIIRIWEGGMSYHGGAIGAIVAMIIMAKHYKKNPINYQEFLASIKKFNFY